MKAMLLQNEKSKEINRNIELQDMPAAHLDRERKREAIMILDNPLLYLKVN
ncbi:hypothetical protein [Sulfuracidifex metallicus]|uniref:hypothetical protein n=1 Tax=Sulfuracidifex metallicus TaxID=47303 RepID=UPI000A5C4577|nr:hypothetical protein [Sulfuracidifex metallicus]WOE50518.1 hypothetical protein RQ359_002051 [Sulfuracidifex metallicus DSM 6482 = JCM 9184]